MPWIIAGAAVIGGLIGSSNASKARKQAKTALEEGRDFAVNKSGLTQIKDSGLAAGKRVDDLLGNNGGDTTSSQQAFDQYLNSSGYRFQQQQGMQALNATANAKGMGNSGATVKAALKFGTGLGSTYFNSYIDKENQVANRGANAATNLASIYSGSGGALAANSINDAAAQNGILNQGLSDFGSFVGDQKGSTTAQPTGVVPNTGGNSSTIFSDNIPKSSRAA